MRKEQATKAWYTVKQTSLVHAWHKLLSDDADDIHFEGFEMCVAEVQIILLHCATSDFGNVDNDNIKKWIESDKTILVIELSLTRKFYRRLTGRRKGKMKRTVIRTC